MTVPTNPIPLQGRVIVLEHDGDECRGCGGPIPDDVTDMAFAMAVSSWASPHGGPYPQLVRACSECRTDYGGLNVPLRPRPAVPYWGPTSREFLLANAKYFCHPEPTTDLISQYESVPAHGPTSMKEPFIDSRTKTKLNFLRWLGGPR